MSKAKAMMLTLGAVGVGAVAVLVGRQSKAAAAEPAKPGAKPGAKPPAAKPPAAKPPAAKPPAAKPPAAQPPAQAKPGPSNTGGGEPIVVPDIKVIPPIPAPGAGPVVKVPSGVQAVPEIQIVPGNATHLAGELALHLITLQLALGGPKQAKAKYNHALAKEFQKTVGLVSDGEPGPKTFVEIARRLTAGTLPLVMFWGKTNTAKDVEAYRNQIRAIAAQAPEPIRSALYTAADRERGQGGINGPLAPQVNTPPAAGPAVKGGATDNMPGISGSPADRA